MNGLFYLGGVSIYLNILSGMRNKKLFQDNSDDVPCHVSEYMVSAPNNASGSSHLHTYLVQN